MTRAPSNTEKLLHEILVSLTGSEELAYRWWVSPNKHWNGECPKDVPLEEVRDYLMLHAFGGW